jgi:uncharacterized protein YggT (Ycf19 family)
VSADGRVPLAGMAEFDSFDWTRLTQEMSSVTTYQTVPGNVEHLHPTKRVLLQVIRGIGYFFYFYVTVVLIVLTLGFFLLLFGANPTSSFVEWVYRSMERAMEPFRGIFTPIELGTTAGDVSAVLDTSVLFAMIMYSILAVVGQQVVAWLTSRINRLDWEDAEYQRRMEFERANMALQAQQVAQPGAMTATPTVPSAMVAPQPVPPVPPVQPVPPAAAPPAL